jgi:triacylglycerol lipase
MVLDALSPQRRRAVLAIAALVLLLIIATVATAVVRSRATSAGPPQSQPGPVLVVPGYGGTASSVQPLVAALRSAGRMAVPVEPIGDGTGDLRAQARHLAVAAERVRRDTNAASVDVVGFSAGGVVARLWVREEGGTGVARRVITIGSPHHGTSQAALGAGLAGGCPEACQQLSPDSDLLRRLNAGDESPDGPLWVTVRTTADRVVTPVDSAALDGALNLVVQEVCPTSTATHGELVSDPVVLATLNSVLGADLPRAPSDVACSSR